VDVEQLDVRLLHDLEHPRREREVVRGVAEQRVARDLHLVVAQPRDAPTQATRPRVADQVHLVPERGRTERDLGGDDAAAADRRVADDAESQRGVGHAPR
jgi:hypothetical protein